MFRFPFSMLREAVPDAGVVSLPGLPILILLPLDPCWVVPEAVCPVEAPIVLPFLLKVPPLTISLLFVLPDPGDTVEPVFPPPPLFLGMVVPVTLLLRGPYETAGP